MDNQCSAVGCDEPVLYTITIEKAGDGDGLAEIKVECCGEHLNVVIPKLAKIVKKSEERAAERLDAESLDGPNYQRYL